MSGEYFRKSIDESNGIVGAAVPGGGVWNSAASPMTIARCFMSRLPSFQLEDGCSRDDARLFFRMNGAGRNPHGVRRTILNPHDDGVAVVAMARSIHPEAPRVGPERDAIVVDQLLPADAAHRRRLLARRGRAARRTVVFHLDEHRAERRIADALFDVRHAFSLKRNVAGLRRDRPLVSFRRDDHAIARLVVDADEIVHVTCSGEGCPFSHAMFHTCTRGLSRIFVAPTRGYAGGSGAIWISAARMTTRRSMAAPLSERRHYSRELCAHLEREPSR